MQFAECRIHRAGTTQCSGSLLQVFEKIEKWTLSAGYDESAEYGDCTLDRINVDCNYEPSNCRWADAKTQAQNKRKHTKSA